MENPIFKTKRFSFLSFLLIFYAIVLAALSIFLIYSIFIDDWGKVLKITLGLVFGLMAIGMSYLFARSSRVYKLYADNIKIFSIWGNQIDQLSFKDIKSWAETEVRSKYGLVYILTLYSENHKISISSSITGDDGYKILKENVTQNIPEDYREEITQSIKAAKLGIIVFSVFFFLAVLATLKFNFSALNNLKTGTFSRDSFAITYRPIIEYNDHGGALTLYVNSPEKKITIYGYNDAIDLEPLKDTLIKGDSLFFEYVTAKHNNFLEKIFGTSRSYVCGLSLNRKHILLDFNRFSQARKDSNSHFNNYFGVILLILAGLVAYYVFKLKFKQKEITELK
jgi:hypothetical protein